MASGSSRRPAAVALRLRWLLVLVAFTAVIAPAATVEDESFVCGTTEPSETVAKQVNSAVQEHRANNRVAAFTTVTIPVYFHVITQVR